MQDHSQERNSRFEQENQELKKIVKDLSSSLQNVLQERESQPRANILQNSIIRSDSHLNINEYVQSASENYILSDRPTYNPAPVDRHSRASGKNRSSIGPMALGGFHSHV